MHIAEWTAAAIVVISVLVSMENKSLGVGVKAATLMIDSFIIVVLVLAAIGH